LVIGILGVAFVSDFDIRDSDLAFSEGESIVSKVILGVVIGLALGAVGAVILVKYPEVADVLKLRQAEKGEEEAPAQAEESFVQHDSNGQIVIKLDPNEQTRIGLQVAPLQAAQAPTEVRGFGRVLDPAPLAALVTEGAAAQAALQASTKEYERVKTLFSQNQNASARALETAEAAMNKDRVALESVQLRLLAGWGKEIASRQDLQAFVASLAARQAALIRADLPLGDRPKVPPSGGRVAPVGVPEDVIEAQILGPAPTTDPQTQTEGYLLLAKTDSGPQSQNSATGRGSPTQDWVPKRGESRLGDPSALGAPSPSLAPGAALVAYLAIPGPARSGVIVPREAVLRHEGGTFVYLQRDDVFQRQAVILERPVGNGWFSDQNLKPQEKVVVVGAQQLLSEELRGQGGEEE
jgi:hypothetical protein